MAAGAAGLVRAGAAVGPRPGRHHRVLGEHGGVLRQLVPVPDPGHRLQQGPAVQVSWPDLIAVVSPTADSRCLAGRWVRLLTIRYRCLAYRLSDSSYASNVYPAHFANISTVLLLHSLLFLLFVQPGFRI